MKTFKVLSALAAYPDAAMAAAVPAMRQVLKAESLATEQRQHLAFLHIDRQAIHGTHGAIQLADVVKLQKRGRYLFRLRLRQCFEH